MYRNTATRKLQYEHPLDQFYREKIAKIKLLTQTLLIQTIPEEKESWLKESNECIGKSRAHDVRSEYIQALIGEVQEEKSVVEGELDRLQEIEGGKGDGTVGRVKEQGYEELRGELGLAEFPSTFSITEVRERRCPLLSTVEQNRKMKELQVLIEEIENKRGVFARLQDERSRKMKVIEELRN